MGEMTVESEVLADILIQDFVMTSRKDKTYKPDESHTNSIGIE